MSRNGKPDSSFFQTCQIWSSTIVKFEIVKLIEKEKTNMIDADVTVS
jgi:hypothetical protein